MNPAQMLLQIMQELAAQHSPRCHKEADEEEVRRQELTLLAMEQRQGRFGRGRTRQTKSLRGN